MKKFGPTRGAVDYAFRRKLTKPGTYKIICTFHEEDNMRMTIVVRK